ncbi:MAG: helix-turn-helix domain-containing protein [Chloroflexi bacterium]|nr:helix-turn-helix domain-containing protein [Chloroflexota bacterium]
MPLRVGGEHGVVALRAVDQMEQEPASRPDDSARPNPYDWLTLQQAACELGLSVSTVRRLIRKGRLRNRIVPRKGGFAYLLYLPGSKHSRGLQGCSHPDAPGRPPRPAPPVRLLDYVREDDATPEDNAEERIARLETQVAHLSQALAQALRKKQRSLPEGDAGQRTQDPYARFRWLARRRRWWRF